MSAPRKVALLDASLLFARKGEAIPAMKQTIQNNPGLAWGEDRLDDDVLEEPKKQQPFKAGLTSTLSVALDEDLFLRLKYMAQQSHGNMHGILTEALERHLSRNGVFKALKLAIKVH